MRRSLLPAVLSLSILLSALASHTASYTFTTINAPNAIDTEATGINTRGQIVGYYAEDTETPPPSLLMGFCMRTVSSPSSASLAHSTPLPWASTMAARS
jgi:hypothetical protein